MTSQMPDFFYYQDKEYCLLGYQGGTLPVAGDFRMKFHAGSTADWRGHCMWYSVHDNKLVAKYVEIRGEEILPIQHHYTLFENERGAFYDLHNAIIPLTGFVLVSDVWDVNHLFMQAMGENQERKYILYELEVNNGNVVSIREIGDVVREKTLADGNENLGVLFQGTTNAEHLTSITDIWNRTAEILGRKYDVLYITFYYIYFKRNVEELQSKSSP